MSALANQIHDLNLGWLEAGCVILQILGALAEPDDGKVQCPQASRPYQLWRWPTDSLSLLREWEGSVQTENAGVLCVRWLFGSYLFIYLFIYLFSWLLQEKQIGMNAASNQLRLFGQMPFFAFFCLFSNKSMLNWLLSEQSNRCKKITLLPTQMKR